MLKIQHRPSRYCASHKVQKTIADTILRTSRV